MKKFIVFLCCLSLFANDVSKAQNEVQNEKPALVIVNNSVYTTLGEILAQKLENEFLKTKKFTLLDRKNTRLYKAEKRLLETSENNKTQDLNAIKGTDYLLVFNLRALDARVQKSLISSSKIKLELVLDYRLLLFASKEVKLSDSLLVNLELKDESLKSAELGLAKTAQNLAQNIINKLYPAFIALMNEKQAYFEEELLINAYYECKGAGRNSLVQVFETKEQGSKARLIQGEAGFGDSCVLSSQKGKEPDYKLGTNGGVNLGF